jgi:hypothetical protein
MLNDDPLLLNATALVEALSWALPQLQLADPALARLVRAAGLAVSHSLAASRLAPRGHAVRHHRRARAHAEALIAHLALADQRGHRIMADQRRLAITHARRIITRLDAAPWDVR